MPLSGRPSLPDALRMHAGEHAVDAELVERVGHDRGRVLQQA